MNGSFRAAEEELGRWNTVAAWAATWPPRDMELTLPPAGRDLREWDGGERRATRCTLSEGTVNGGKTGRGIVNGRGNEENGHEEHEELWEMTSLTCIAVRA